MKLNFVTGNENKFREVKEMLNIEGVELSRIEIDLPELQGTPKEVALAKAKLAYEKVGEPVFVDDTGLAFNALNGMPGIYIKDFLKALGHEGLNKILMGYDDKSAKAFVSIGYCDSKGAEWFIGECEGKIVPAKDSGEGFKFGWDPIFEPKGYLGETFGTLPSDIKNSISHRRNALTRFLEWFSKQNQ